MAEAVEELVLNRGVDDGKGHRERGTATLGRGDVNASLVCLDDGGHDGQTETTTSGLTGTRVVCAVEAFKDFLANLLGDTLTMIHD